MHSGHKTEDKISYRDSDIPGDKQKLNTDTDSSKVESSEIQIRSSREIISCPPVFICIHLTSYTWTVADFQTGELDN